MGKARSYCLAIGAATIADPILLDTRPVALLPLLRQWNGIDIYAVATASELSSSANR